MISGQRVNFEFCTYRVIGPEKEMKIYCLFYQRELLNQVVLAHVPAQVCPVSAAMGGKEAVGQRVHQHQGQDLARGVNLLAPMAQR